MRLPVGRRDALIFVDQGVSSLSNLVGSVAVARAADVDAFGKASIAFFAYALALGASRALFGETLVSRVRGGASEAADRSAAVLGSLLFGLILAAIAVPLGVATSLAPLAILGLGLPLLLAQDACRWASFVEGRPARAIVADVVWLVLVVVFAVVANGKGGTVAFASWILAGCLSALFFLTIERPTLASPLEFIRTTWPVGRGYLGEFVLSTGAGQAVFLLSSLVLGLASMAALRGGQVLLGPLAVVFPGALLVLNLQGRALVGEGRSAAVTRMALVGGLALAALSLLWTSAVVALPESIGTALLGDSWGAARVAAVGLGIAQCVAGLTHGAAAGLRVFNESGRSFSARLVATPVLVVSSLGLALWLGLPGLLFGMILGQVALATAYWVTYRRSPAWTGLGGSREGLPGA